jgi:hypothetical protein
MPLPSAIRPEYFDSAISKTSDTVELLALHELRTLAVDLDKAELSTQEQCLANRLAAGENPKRVGAPKSVMSASERAAAEIHKLELRKCRRAVSASEIVASMLRLIQDDIAFGLPLLPKIDLQANREIAEQLLAKKLQLALVLSRFLERHQSAA